jgi:histidine triad (HIT) family protein
MEKSTMSGIDSLFERIASGDVPSYEVFSDEHVFAFLDINPLSRGHTLVIPRKRFVQLHEVPEGIAKALGSAVVRVARAVVMATGATGYNVLQNNGSIAGQAVPHVHFHIIPKYADGTGLPHHWPAGALDKDDAEALCGAIAGEI